MITVLKKMLRILNRGDKKKLILLTIIHLLSSIVGLFGIASIIPFMKIVSDPHYIISNKWLKMIYEFTRFSDITNFIVFVGGVLLVVFIFSNVIIALSTWYNIRFSRNIGISLSQNIYNKYLSNNYEFFLQRNSSELLKNIISEVNNVITQTIKPLVDLISKAFLTLAILSFLIYYNPITAFFVIFVLGGVYILIFTIIKKSLSHSGTEMVKWNMSRHKEILESFGGIKDVKLMSKENYFFKNFTRASKNFENNLCHIQILGQMPKYFLETIAFGGILALSLTLIILKKNVNEIFPVLAVYAFAGYRLMPAIEAVFRSFASIRGSSASLDLLYKEVYIDTSRLIAHIPLKSDKSSIQLNNEIVLKNIVFTYANKEKPIFNGINLSIQANTTVAFVGTTGCGKTTIIDIMLGLLKPDAGELIVDDVEITDLNLRDWQKQIGYVPQHIFLSDDTIKSNIAFGVDVNDINESAVIQAAKIANLDNFIANELDEGYNTIVGDKGVRLSGGQRQRIGIARALYNNPDLLVFDEATSALDNVTEAAVMEAIESLTGKKTIIIIAHRLSTVKKCDMIYFIEKGSLSSSGTYEELLQNSEGFREIASKS